MLSLNDIVKERDNAVVLAWTTGNFDKFYEYVAKYSDLDNYILFKLSSDKIKKLTIAKMICNITSKEVIPYHNECKKWLKKVGSSEQIN